MDAVIFDIDGTLCDVTSIRHFVTKTATKNFKDFSSFHEAALACPPIQATVDSLRQWQSQGFKVLAVTAREAQWMQPTIWWLHLNGIHVDELYMRGLKDYRRDYEIKKDLLRWIQQDGYKVHHAWDDNPSIIKLWQEEGIPCTVVPGWED